MKILGYACARTRQVVWNNVDHFGPCKECVPITSLPLASDADVERAAPIIYDLMRAFDSTGAEYPWLPGGNSDKAVEARRIARRVLEAAR